MRVVPVLLMISLCGCAGHINRGNPDIMDGELYISPNKVHTISLDDDEIWSFRLKFDAGMRMYNATEEAIWKQQQRRGRSRDEKHNILGVRH